MICLRRALALRCWPDIPSWTSARRYASWSTSKHFNKGVGMHILYNIPYMIEHKHALLFSRLVDKLPDSIYAIINATHKGSVVTCVTTIIIYISLLRLSNVLCMKEWLMFYAFAGNLGHDIFPCAFYQGIYVVSYDPNKASLSLIMVTYFCSNGSLCVFWLPLFPFLNPWWGRRWNLHTQPDYL